LGFNIAYAQDLTGIWEAKKVVVPKSSFEPGPSRLYYRIEIDKVNKNVYVGRSYSSVRMRFWNSLGEPIIIFPSKAEADFKLTVTDLDNMSFKESNGEREGPGEVWTRAGQLKYVVNGSDALLVGTFGSLIGWAERPMKITLRKIADIPSAQ